MAGRRERLSLLSLVAIVAVLAACATAEAQADLATPSSTRVRSLDARASALVAAAVAASPTVAGLLEALASADVIVFVEVTLAVRHAGDLRFLGRGSGSRFLRVRISAAQTPQKQLAALGHELQHAREVAEARQVQDEAGLAALMARIGWSSAPGMFETEAAVLVGHRVRGEIGK